MLEEKKIIDKIEIVKEGSVIQVREKIQILKDGIEVAGTYHRYLISKDTYPQMENVDIQVKKIADAIWNE